MALLNERIFFFLLLFVLVLLGDGKQEIVDIVAAAGILALFILRVIQGRSLGVLPKSLQSVWAIVLGYLAIRTVFADSVGYAISSSVRWIMAYVVFIFFTSSPSENRKRERFENEVVGFGIIVFIASAFVSMMPELGQTFPGMNLLYPRYGHNHVAAIGIFLFPLLLYRLKNRSSVKNVFLTLMVGASLFASFARGAWLLISGYISFLLLFSKHRFYRFRWVLLGCVVLICGLFISGLFTRWIPNGALGGYTIERLIIKPTVLQNRLPYWGQAISAAQSRPWIGSGPGSFYLLSKRYQQEQNRYSWYAHSFPLELLAETGVIGVILVSVLIVFIFRKLHSTPLVYSLLLTGIYGLYEINLNFLVIWLLWWATAGVLWKEHVARADKQYLPVLAVGALVVVYGAAMLAVVCDGVPSLNRYAFYIEPHIVTRALHQIEKESLRPWDLALITAFHRQDPVVLEALATYKAKTAPEEAARIFLQFLKADPQTSENWNTYLEFAQKQRPLIAQEAIRTYVSIYGPAFFQKDIPLPSGKEVVYAQNMLGNVLLADKKDQRNNFLRIFYAFGLSAISDDPQRARLWWMLARDANPSWSHVHVELASFALNVLGDSDLAQEYLDYCNNQFDASGHCSPVSLQALPHPGSSAEVIKTMNSEIKY